MAWGVLTQTAFARAVPPSTYVGQIIPLGDFGVFEISGDPRIEEAPPHQHYFRLWGVVVNSDNLAKLAGDEQYSCIEVGTVETNTVGNVRVARCRTASIPSLTMHLINAGAATAICVELGVDEICNAKD